MKVTTEISIEFPETDDTHTVKVDLAADNVVTLRQSIGNARHYVSIRLQDLVIALNEFDKRRVE